MYNLVFFICFIYLQVLPTTQDPIQFFLIFLLLAGSLFRFSQSISSVTSKISSKDKNVDERKKTLAFKIIMINSLVFTLFGLMANQPGASEYLLIETIIPLVYLAIFFTGKSNANISKLINLCFTISTFIIGIIFILQMLSFGGVIDSLGSLSDSSEIDGIATTDSKVTGLRFIPLPSLAYLTPISLHNLADSINKRFLKAQSKDIKKVLAEYFLIVVYLFNFTSTLVCIILSGRQGLLVGFLGSLLVIIIVQILASFTRRHKNTMYVKAGEQHIIMIAGIISFFVVLILLTTNVVDFISINADLINAFIAKNAVDSERIGQFNSLIDSWHQSPIIGHGNGSVVSVIRNEVRPWRYELGYILKLNNTGLLGLSIHFFGVFLICTSLIKKFYQTGDVNYISSLAGLLSLLIADGTNPYMIRFTVLYYFYYCLWLSMHEESSPLAAAIIHVPFQSRYGQK
jgi:hypothetical protein